MGVVLSYRLVIWQRPLSNLRAMTSFEFHKILPYFLPDSGITPDAEGYMELSAGRHEYPFNFTLPGRLPTSFEGTYGQVRYHLLATVDGPKRNRITREPFTVLGNLDLNKKPECKVIMRRGLESEAMGVLNRQSWTKSWPLSRNLQTPFLKKNRIFIFH